jgi:hypothetical protein
MTATISDGLIDLADRVDDMKWRDVWPSLHRLAYPVDDQYADRVGIVFHAVCAAAGCSMTYLGAVLKARHKDRDLGPILKTAAGRVV